MLKLHHMNLLNEIQETTLMMNLYQQQQLQHDDATHSLDVEHDEDQQQHQNSPGGAATLIRPPGHETGHEDCPGRPGLLDG